MLGLVPVTIATLFLLKRSTSDYTILEARVEFDLLPDLLLVIGIDNFR